MKCDKYMGMDVHQAMTVVVVLDADGKVVMETMVPTEAAAIIRLVRSLSGPLRVTFEETTQAAWLYEVIRAYVTEVIVCDPRRNKQELAATRSISSSRPVGGEMFFLTAPFRGHWATYGE